MTLERLCLGGLVCADRRAGGAECRDDYLRGVANENGLPLECVRKIADRLGEREDFGALILICEGRRGLAQ